jgi:hypothetical protein
MNDVLAMSNAEAQNFAQQVLAQNVQNAFRSAAANDSLQEVPIQSGRLIRISENNSGDDINDPGTGSVLIGGPRLTGGNNNATIPVHHIAEGRSRRPRRRRRT